MHEHLNPTRVFHHRSLHPWEMSSSAAAVDLLRYGRAAAARPTLLRQAKTMCVTKATQASLVAVFLICSGDGVFVPLPLYCCVSSQSKSFPCFLEHDDNGLHVVEMYILYRMHSLERRAPISSIVKVCLMSCRVPARNV